MNSKRMLMVMALAGQLFGGTGTTLASLITVDCTNATSSLDMTLPNSPSLDGITCRFDNGGINPDPNCGNADTATLGAGGIAGNTEDTLLVDDAQLPANLTVHFSLRNSAPLPLPVTDGLFVMVDNEDSGLTPATFYKGAGDAAEELSFATTNGFTHPELYFSADAPALTMSSLTYAIPEPSLVVPALVAMALLMRRRFIRRV